MKMDLFQQLWDYVHIVQTSVEDWKTTPWRQIDVENMDLECKKFAKEIRGKINIQLKIRGGQDGILGFGTGNLNFKSLGI